MLTSAATARSIPRILRQSARSRVAFTAALAQCTSVSKHSFRSIEHETRSLALLPRTQTGTSFRRYASLTESTLSKTHAGEEKHLQQGKLSSDSHAESEASSAKPSSGARGESAEEEDVDMLAGIKSDMVGDTTTGVEGHWLFKSLADGPCSLSESHQRHIRLG